MSYEDVFFVKQGYSGTEFKTRQIPYKADSTIAEVKSMLRDVIGVPEQFQDLRFDDQRLDDRFTVGSYGIDVFETLILYLHTGTYEYELIRSTIDPSLQEPEGAGTQCVHLAPSTGIEQRIRNLGSGSCVLGFVASGVVTYSISFIGSGGVVLRGVEHTVGGEPQDTSNDDVNVAASSMTAFEIHLEAPSGTRSALLSFTAGPSQAALLDLVTLRGRSIRRGFDRDPEEEAGLPSTS
jgi:hypothetical protein